MNVFQIYNSSPKNGSKDPIGQCMVHSVENMQSRGYKDIVHIIETEKHNNDIQQISEEIDRLSDDSNNVLIVHCPLPRFTDPEFIEMLKGKGTVITFMHEFSDEKFIQEIVGLNGAMSAEKIKSNLHHIAALSDKVIVSTDSEKKALLDFDGADGDITESKITICPIPPNILSKNKTQNIDFKERRQLKTRYHPTYLGQICQNRGIEDLVQVARLLKAHQAHYPKDELFKDMKIRIAGRVNEQDPEALAVYKDLVKAAYTSHDKPLLNEQIDQAKSIEEIYEHTRGRKPSLPIELYPNLSTEEASELLESSDIMLNCRQRGASERSGTTKDALENGLTQFAYFHEDISERLAKHSIKINYSDNQAERARDAWRKLQTYIRHIPEPQKRQRVRAAMKESRENYSYDHMTDVFEKMMKDCGLQIPHAARAASKYTTTSVSL